MPHGRKPSPCRAMSTKHEMPRSRPWKTKFKHSFLSHASWGKISSVRETIKTPTAARDTERFYYRWVVTHPTLYLGSRTSGYARSAKSSPASFWSDRQLAIFLRHTYEYPTNYPHDYVHTADVLCTMTQMPGLSCQAAANFCWRTPLKRERPSPRSLQVRRNRWIE